MDVKYFKLRGIWLLTNFLLRVFSVITDYCYSVLFPVCFFTSFLACRSMNPALIFVSADDRTYKFALLGAFAVVLSVFGFPSMRSAFSSYLGISKF